MPLEVYGGDRLLYAPKIVTVTFPNESNATTFESFGDTVTATPWWDAITAGYCDKSNKCLGRGTGGKHVHVTTAAASSYNDSSKPADTSSIKDFINAHIADKSFPEPDENTLYVIYFPSSTSISLANGGQNATSCTAFGGYHSFLHATKPSGGTVDVAYAIVPQCNNPLIPVNTQEAASHEIIEAVTDPLVSDTTANGFYMDQSRIAWTQISAAEVGDACALLKDFAANPLANPGPEEYSESGFTVQKSWSNSAVLAGKDPCVPQGTDPYFNVAPEAEKLIMKKGDSKVVELTGFSSGPVSDWDVKAIDFSSLSNPFAPKVISLSLDQAKANNGTKLHLTINATGTIDPNSGGASIVLVSTSGNAVSYWPLIVTAN
jgi:hypothetical protein